MKKLGKSTKKGFTLVELIVVLVILAILAAMLVPALVGYIDRAKKEKEYQAASTVYTAAQALATEAYGQNKTSADAKAYAEDPDEIKTLTGITVNKVTVTMVTPGGTDIDGYTINNIEVQFKDGDSVYSYTLNDATWSADKPSSGSGSGAANNQQAGS